MARYRYNNARSLYQYLRFMPRHGPSECYGMRGSLSLR